MQRRLLCTLVWSPGAFCRERSIEPAAKKQILVVDDHEDTRRAVTVLLRRHGYDVKSAGSKAEALSLCESSSFDLLLGDITLPDGTGLDLMREVSERCKIRGIAVTGHGSQKDIADALAAGFYACLIKPVEKDLMISTIENALAESEKSA